MLAIIFFYLYIAIAVILIISSFKAKKLRLLFISLCIAWIVIPIYRVCPVRREPYVNKARVIVGESDKYGRDEIESAIEYVRNYIHNNEDHCRLLKLEYNYDIYSNSFGEDNLDKYITITAYIHYGIKSEYWTYDDANISSLTGNVADTYILLFDSSVGEWKIYAY